ncbi:MAG: phospholipase A [Nonlabens sp.]
MKRSLKNHCIITICSCVFIFYSLHPAAAQESRNALKGEDSLKQLIKSLPGFSNYGDAYFITGISVDEPVNEETSDAKIAFGFKQRLSNWALPYESYVYFTYRQQTFWDFYQESFPIRENNYQPGLGIYKIFHNDTKITGGLWLGFEHQSNGRDGDRSRSWNKFYGQFLKPINNNALVRLKAWAPVGGMDGNEDITDFRGFFELGSTYRPIKNVLLDFDFRQSFSDGLRGSLKLGISYKISKTFDQFIYLQYFNGYSEDLINYDRQVNNLRIGIAFRDLFSILSKRKRCF